MQSGSSHTCICFEGQRLELSQTNEMNVPSFCRGLNFAHTTNRCCFIVQRRYRYKKKWVRYFVVKYGLIKIEILYSPSHNKENVSKRLTPSIINEKCNELCSHSTSLLPYCSKTLQIQKEMGKVLCHGVYITKHRLLLLYYY